MDANAFYEGYSFDAYEYLGAHVVENGTVFRVYAPEANGAVVLHGGNQIPMGPAPGGNFWECYVEGAREGDCYEYIIYDKHDTPHYKADPFGFGMELRPDHHSVIRDLNRYEFHDGEWMQTRTNRLHEPLNIYELHVGSWRTKAEPEQETEDTDWYNYEELAAPLAEYLKESGYNYVEFMPLSEHPADVSWGYQNTGFFAPTSRYGTAQQLMYLVDYLHQNGIGVILDYVAVHFATDFYGLERFDGSYLYEYPSKDVGVSEWGSYNFMHARGEVRSFLQSSANYWLQKYHIDGLRMDAISRILYWQGEEARGVNARGVQFLKTMNQGLKDRNPGIMLIAEDSTSFDGVTRETQYGGLGFDYKWDMGWMHDTLEYFQAGPEYRKRDYHKLTFSMMYFYNEHFLLPLSHDEVVHGKATILQKMNGQYEEKFPQARALYLYMMVHPGKTLNFMGNEFGQLREWDEKRQQDWFLLTYPIQDAFYHYMKELNHIYQTNPALYQQDYDGDGFKWMDCQQEDRRVYVLQRRCLAETMIAVFNFSDYDQDYELKNLNFDRLRPMLHTDWLCWNGTEPEDRGPWAVTKGKLMIHLPRFSGILFRAENE